jgi:serine/threonine protein kinase
VTAATRKSRGVSLGLPQFAELEQVGDGAYSVVYRSFVEDHGRYVAIKVLNVDHVDERARNRFVREFETMAKLSDHPNIVTLHQAGLSTSGRPYIVMDYWPAGSYGAYLRDEGPLTVPEILDLGVLLAGALATAHLDKIRHRDIKPENLLRADHGPVLCDFGIAELDEQAASASAAQFTPYHMPPEMPTHTEASDVYSLASTLYTLLEGAPPFVAEKKDNLGELIDRIKSDPPRPFTMPVPDDLQAAIFGAMGKDPSTRRPRTARDLGIAFQAVQRRLGLTVTKMVIPDIVVEPAPSDGPSDSTTGSVSALAPVRSSHTHSETIAPEVPSHLTAPPLPSDEPSAAAPEPGPGFIPLRRSTETREKATNGASVDGLDTFGRPVEEPTRTPRRVIALRMLVVLIVAGLVGALLAALTRHNSSSSSTNPGLTNISHNLAFQPPPAPGTSSAAAKTTTSPPIVAKPGAPSDVAYTWTSQGVATVTWKNHSSVANGYLLALARFATDPATGAPESTPTAYQYVGDDQQAHDSIDGLKLLGPSIETASLSISDLRIVTCLEVIATGTRGTSASPQICLPDTPPTTPTWAYPDGQAANVAVAPGPITLNWTSDSDDEAGFTIYQVAPGDGRLITFKTVGADATSMVWPAVAADQIDCFVIHAENGAALYPQTKDRPLQLPPEQIRKACFQGVPGTPAGP